MPAPVVVSVAPSSSLTQSLNANAGTIAMGAGVLLLIVFFARGGR
jgi:hypothetical protein